MLEAMQMTFVTAPTLMARFPGGRHGRSRWVMIPGNEPTGDGRYVGITTVTARSGWRSARVMGRDDMADDDELGTMLGRFVRADEVNARCTRGRRAHTADEVVAACVDARVPATIVGNGAELPRFDHSCERDVFVAQPGEAWIRPRAPFRFHGVADRELVAPAAADRGRAVARTAPRAARRRTRSASVRSRASRVLDFTAFWAGPVRDRVARARWAPT